jgi:aminoglycoside phosphotransferase (APT) family kinase protein
VRGLDVPMRKDTPSCEWARGNGPEVIARYLDSPRGRHFPAAIKAPERIDAGFWAMIDDMAVAAPRCVLHGDSHPGNTFFDADGRPGLYDWQTLAFGPWAHDISYYISSALSVADRRSSDHALLRHYLGALQARGVDPVPSFDEAWLAQRRYIAYGLHIWITNRTEFQSEENCTALTTRLGAAAEDYEFFDAWGV